MKTYAQMKAEIRSILDETNHNDWLIYPGPTVPDISTSFVVCTPYGGPGLDQDGAIDQRSWQFRFVGKQGTEAYESSESAANAVDLAFISHYSSKIGDVWVPQIQRVGGAPSPLLVDDAERVHFICSYTIDVAMALPN